MEGVSTRSVPVGEIRRFGDHAFLLGVQDPSAARGLTRALSASKIPGVREVVGGLATVMVAFDPEAGDLEARRPLLLQVVRETLDQPSPESGERKLSIIPCTFDGQDLFEVAATAGCAPERVIELVTSLTLTVAAVGFSPGFAYLAGLPDELCAVPRRRRPRPSVPAGSVALANGFAAVYPTSSPGGWQLIGRTPEPFFTPDMPPYARVAPGDRVRFTVADEWRGRRSPAAKKEASSPPFPVTARPVFEVEDAGLRTVLQDGGRRGLAAVGVPTASAADPYSFRLANRLVGNADDACALEVTARGPALRCLDSTFVAVVGASPDLQLQGRPVTPGRVLPVMTGQRLVVGPVWGGFRSYVAVAGSFVGPVVLGSYASDQLSGLGPGPIVRGAQLWAATPNPPMGDHLRDSPSDHANADGAISLRVVPGPHHERFAAGALASLGSLWFMVDPESNRVGLRLRRVAQALSVPWALGSTAELDSQGMVTGAVQVPPDGDPVILLTDHATLGGYPVVAVVAAVDHGLLGQCAPGTTVALVPIDHGAADEALRRQRRFMETAVVGRYPLAVE